MRVRFEPLGEEIECAAGETVLDAAFRQGYNLVYGCREGQCSACKCFLLEGDVALKRYSTFALSDSESSNGYSLMCRAMPEQDLVIELLHYDPDNYRLEHAIQTATATVDAIEPLTDEITRVVLRAPGFRFTPGQYVDIHVDGSKRSFSMANADADRIELIVRRYPGGRFSGKLDGRLGPGDELEFTGPYGALHVRESERPILMIAGGSGIAPILSLLRHLESTGCSRPVRLFFAARKAFATGELDALALPDFELQIVDNLVVNLVDDFVGKTPEFAAADIYMCGPPSMIDAAQEMLTASHKVDEQRIFTDRFTTAAEAAPEVVVSTEPERDFTWYAPAKRRASLYEDVTIDTQPSVHRHLTRGWPLSFEDGRGTWNDSSTALASADWFAFRDPGEQWERPYYQAGTAIEHQIEGAMRSAVEEGLVDDFTPEWVEFLRANLQVPAYVEHGLWFALATIGRDCLSDSVATCVCLQAAMKQRSAQAIVLYAMDLEEHHGPFPIEAARDAFLTEPAWQPARRYLERLAATSDWGEVIVAANLVFEPIVGTLLRRELGIRTAAANGDTITPVLARAASQEWEWSRAWTAALIRFLLEDDLYGAANRGLISEIVADWTPQAFEAAEALAPLAPVEVDLERLRSYAEDVLVEAGLHRESKAVTAVRRVREPTPSAATSSGRALPAPRTPSEARPPSPNGTYDFVGIVMAKSAEGDAVADILRRREGIEVLEQPAFWDIRAESRLEIPYREVTEQLGYEIDAYSIQHEMSTHYGRMVATDDALMLFSDPTEAMQYLMR